MLISSFWFVAHISAFCKTQQQKEERKLAAVNQAHTHKVVLTKWHVCVFTKWDFKAALVLFSKVVGFRLFISPPPPPRQTKRCGWPGSLSTETASRRVLSTLRLPPNPAIRKPQGKGSGSMELRIAFHQVTPPLTHPANLGRE